MNELQIFNNSEFGEIRTITKDGEPMFCLADVCKALEISNVSQLKTRLIQDGVITNEVIDSLGRKQNATFINESNLYKTIFQSRKESAERFTEWVTSEVLPAIRKTGGYGKPMTPSEQIQVIAKGYVELEQEVHDIKYEVTDLKDNMPLYGCEIDEVSNHVKRKAVNVLGGKESEAYRDSSIRGKVFSDIYTQIKREFGLVSSYKSIKRKYLEEVHEFINDYQPPRVLEEDIRNANAQLRMI